MDMERNIKTIRGYTKCSMNKRKKLGEKAR